MQSGRSLIGGTRQAGSYETGTMRVCTRKAGFILGAVIGLGALGVPAGMALGQTRKGHDPASDETLTFHGITLYGIIDVGLQYETHGAPFSDFHPAGSSNIVQKNSRQSAFGATPSNMSQSRIGVQGLEPLGGDWYAVFKLETFFNPQSGQIADASKSMVLNNGRTPATQTTNLNSSVAGQPFESAYVGFSSKTFGSITFGRQLTLVADGVNKYDPNYGSQAFSLIGMSGGYSGAGDTEDKRIDSTLRYSASHADWVHFGALYKFNGATGSANSAAQADIGVEYAGASVDAYYSKFNGAVSNGPLSAAQVAALPGLGFSVNNSLSGTISDNTAFAVMGLYALNPFKFFLSYEHIKFANPTRPLAAGYNDIGGYTEAFVNNNAYPKAKIYDVYWSGVRYTVIPHVELTAAVYYVRQNAYGTGADAGCTTSAHPVCSGDLQAFSFDADYTLSKRFDVYAGAMYSAVHNGLANGYLLQTTNINPTAGVRFKF